MNGEIITIDTALTLMEARRNNGVLDSEINELREAYANYTDATTKLAPYIADLRSDMKNVNKLCLMAGMTSPFILSYEDIKKEVKAKADNLKSLKEERDALKKQGFTIEAYTEAHPGLSAIEVERQVNEANKRLDNLEKEIKRAEAELEKSKRKRKNLGSAEDIKEKSNSVEYILSLLENRGDIKFPEGIDERIKNQIKTALFSIDINIDTVKNKQNEMEKSIKVFKAAEKRFGFSLLYGNKKPVVSEKKVTNESIKQKEAELAKKEKELNDKLKALAEKEKELGIEFDTKTKDKEKELNLREQAILEKEKQMKEAEERAKEPVTFKEILQNRKNLIGGIQFGKGKFGAFIEVGEKRKVVKMARFASLVPYAKVALASGLLSTFAFGPAAFLPGAMAGLGAQAIWETVVLLNGGKSKAMRNDRKYADDPALSPVWNPLRHKVVDIAKALKHGADNTANKTRESLDNINAPIEEAILQHIANIEVVAKQLSDAGLLFEKDWDSIHGYKNDYEKARKSKNTIMLIQLRKNLEALDKRLTSVRNNQVTYYGTEMRRNESFDSQFSNENRPSNDNVVNPMGIEAGKATLEDKPIEKETPKAIADSKKVEEVLKDNLYNSNNSSNSILLETKKNKYHQELLDLNVLLVSLGNRADVAEIRKAHSFLTNMLVNIKDQASLNDVEVGINNLKEQIEVVKANVAKENLETRIETILNGIPDMRGRITTKLVMEIQDSARLAKSKITGLTVRRVHDLDEIEKMVSMLEHLINEAELEIANNRKMAELEAKKTNELNVETNVETLDEPNVSKIDDTTPFATLHEIASNNNVTPAIDPIINSAPIEEIKPINEGLTSVDKGNNDMNNNVYEDVKVVPEVEPSITYEAPKSVELPQNEKSPLIASLDEQLIKNGIDPKTDAYYQTRVNMVNKHFEVLMTLQELMSVGAMNKAVAEGYKKNLNNFLVITTSDRGENLAVYEEQIAKIDKSLKDFYEGAMNKAQQQSQQVTAPVENNSQNSEFALEDLMAADMPMRR